MNLCVSDGIMWLALSVEELYMGRRPAKSSTWAIMAHSVTIPHSKHSGDEKAQSDEKHDSSSSTMGEGDEALRLIGLERVEQFSEEYNKRLRRKLVRPCANNKFCDI